MATRTARTLAVLLVLLSLSAALFAAEGNKQPQGAFPEATFEGTFGKFFGGNSDIYNRFFRWDADLGIHGTGYRKGKNAFVFDTDFSVIGAQILKNNHVATSGSAYIAGGAFERQLTDRITMEIGLWHLSSHVSTDVTAETAILIAARQAVPRVTPQDVNVPAIMFTYRATGKEWGPLGYFQPESTIRIQPADIRFRAGYDGRYERPVGFETRLRLFGKNRILSVLDHSEWGSHSFNDVSLHWNPFGRNGQPGPFELAAGYSDTAHDYLPQSPWDGWHHQGFYTTFGVRFHAVR